MHGEIMLAGLVALSLAAIVIYALTRRRVKPNARDGGKEPPRRGKKGD